MVYFVSRPMILSFRKREKTEKAPPPPPKAGGWQQILEEMAKKQKGGGLKKVEAKEERKVGKLNTGKKKGPGEFVDIVDELKHRLARLRGEVVEEEEETAPAPAPVPAKSTKKAAAPTKKEDSSPNVASTKAPEVTQSSEPPAASDPSKAVAKPVPLNIPLPPPLPTAWPPVPYIAPAAPPKPDPAVTTNATTATIAESKEEVHPKPPENTQTRRLSTVESRIKERMRNMSMVSNTPSNTPSVEKKLSTGTEMPASISAPVPEQGSSSSSSGYLIPVPTKPVGLHTSSRLGSVPLPSGYYVPAPRLDMVEPGKYEFGGLTTQRQIDAINRLIRTTIHQQHQAPDQKATAPSSSPGNTSIPPSNPAPQLSVAAGNPNASAPLQSVRIKSPSKQAMSAKAMTPRLRFKFDDIEEENKANNNNNNNALETTALNSNQLDQIQETNNGFYDDEGIHTETYQSDSMDEDYSSDDSYDDNYSSSTLPHVSIDILQLARSSDGHVINSYKAHPMPVDSQAAYSLPTGFHSNVQRIRKARLKQKELLKQQASMELRAYDDDVLACEQRRSGLPTGRERDKPLTVSRSYRSAVDQRLMDKQTKPLMKSHRKEVSQSSSDKLPLCQYIDRVFVADSSLMNGFKDVGVANWVSNLRNGEDLATPDNRMQTTRSQSPEFTRNLEERREKKRRLRQKEMEDVEKEKQQVKHNREILRLKAIAAAQSSGVYSPMLSTNDPSYSNVLMRPYLQRLVGKYGRPRALKSPSTSGKASDKKSKRRSSQHDDMDQSKSDGSIILDSDERFNWAKMSSHPDYAQAMAMHQMFVMKKEPVNLDDYV